MYKYLICFCSAVFFLFQGFAQDNSKVHFRKLIPADFIVTKETVDSTADAVILSDIGSTEFEGNKNGDFSLIFKRHKRVLIRNRKAFEVATVKVPVYIGNNFSNEEKFENFEANTYTLENGLVVASKLDKSAVFIEKISRERTIRKFTFPNLKEGCIIEYSYTIKSPFYSRLRSWFFQDTYPCLWSEYSVTIPPMFNYTTSRRGYLPYEIDTTDRVYKNYVIVEQNGVSDRNEVYRISGDALFAKWAVKDAPAFKVENYTSALSNHMNMIEFQLQSIKYSENNVTQIMKNWFETSANMMKDPDFGLTLTEENNWLSDALKQVATNTNVYEKARKIHEYVRDNFICNDHDAIWLSQPLKKTFQTKSGNVSDINLLLTAAFISMGYEATPVILSTRENGFISQTMPILSQYNYVLSRVRIGDNYLLLDASRKRLGFGKLHADAYNFSARVIDSKFPTLLDLSPDSLKESKSTFVVIVNSEDKGMAGSFASSLGYLESMRLREKMNDMKTDDFAKELKKNYPAEIEVSNIVVDSLRLYDEPVKVKYEMKINVGEEDVIYFNPLFSESWKKNPFTVEKRLYPVEMPNPINELYLLNMEVPKGYRVDEIPKSTRMRLNGDEGMFEYIVSANAERIQLSCRLIIGKTVFSSEDYQALRDFFAVVVTKEAEQIVFKKTNK